MLAIWLALIDPEGLVAYGMTMAALKSVSVVVKHLLEGAAVDDRLTPFKTGAFLAAERFEAERRNAVSYELARKRALETALIPMVNVFLAVGLVSLPGMMTGQILSGIAPLIAARYQLMVMCMLFGAGGISAACFLLMQRPRPATV